MESIQKTDEAICQYHTGMSYLRVLPSSLMVYTNSLKILLMNFVEITLEIDLFLLNRHSIVQMQCGQLSRQWCLTRMGTVVGYPVSQKENTVKFATITPCRKRCVCAKLQCTLMSTA